MNRLLCTPLMLLLASCGGGSGSGNDDNPPADPISHDICKEVEIDGEWTPLEVEETKAKINIQDNSGSAFEVTQITVEHFYYLKDNVTKVHHLPTSCGPAKSSKYDENSYSGNDQGLAHFLKTYSLEAYFEHGLYHRPVIEGPALTEVSNLYMEFGSSLYNDSLSNFRVHKENYRVNGLFTADVDYSRLHTIKDINNVCPNVIFEKSRIIEIEDVNPENDPSAFIPYLDTKNPSYLKLESQLLVTADNCLELDRTSQWWDLYHVVDNEIESVTIKSKTTQGAEHICSYMQTLNGELTEVSNCSDEDELDSYWFPYWQAQYETDNLPF